MYKLNVDGCAAAFCTLTENETRNRRRTGAPCPVAVREYYKTKKERSHSLFLSSSSRKLQKSSRKQVDRQVYKVIQEHMVLSSNARRGGEGRGGRGKN